jgi:hypothetical protein
MEPTWGSSMILKASMASGSVSSGFLTTGSPLLTSKALNASRSAGEGR